MKAPKTVSSSWSRRNGRKNTTIKWPINAHGWCQWRRKWKVTESEWSTTSLSYNWRRRASTVVIQTESQFMVQHRARNCSLMLSDRLLNWTSILIDFFVLKVIVKQTWTIKSRLCWRKHLFYMSSAVITNIHQHHWSKSMLNRHALCSKWMATHRKMALASTWALIWHHSINVLL